MNEKSETISFRLHPTFAKELTEQAIARKQSPGELARHLVVSALSDSGEDETRRELQELREKEIAELRASLKGLRADLAKGLVALLVQIGNVDVNEAQAWARENLLK